MNCLLHCSCSPHSTVFFHNKIIKNQKELWRRSIFSFSSEISHATVTSRRYNWPANQDQNNVFSRDFFFKRLDSPNYRKLENNTTSTHKMLLLLQSMKINQFTNFWRGQNCCKVSISAKVPAPDAVLIED